MCSPENRSGPVIGDESLARAQGGRMDGDARVARCDAKVLRLLNRGLLLTRPLQDFRKLQFIPNTVENCSERVSLFTPFQRCFNHYAWLLYPSPPPCHAPPHHTELQASPFSVRRSVRCMTAPPRRRPPMSPLYLRPEWLSCCVSLLRYQVRCLAPLAWLHIYLMGFPRISLISLHLPSSQLRYPYTFYKFILHKHISIAQHPSHASILFPRLPLLLPHRPPRPQHLHAHLTTARLSQHN
jgi:hypothetical protein